MHYQRIRASDLLLLYFGCVFFFNNYFIYYLILRETIIAPANTVHGIAGESTMQNCRFLFIRSSASYNVKLAGLWLDGDHFRFSVCVCARCRHKSCEKETIARSRIVLIALASAITVTSAYILCPWKNIRLLSALHRDVKSNFSGYRDLFLSSGAYLNLQSLNGRKKVSHSRYLQ